MKQSLLSNHFDMKTMTSEQAVKQLPKILNNQSMESIAITKHNRKHAVIIPSTEYETLKSNRDMEDYILGELATHALNDGALSIDESKAFMQDLSNFSVEGK